MGMGTSGGEQAGDGDGSAETGIAAGPHGMTAQNTVTLSLWGSSRPTHPPAWNANALASGRPSPVECFTGCDAAAGGTATPFPLWERMASAHTARMLSRC